MPLSRDAIAAGGCGLGLAGVLLPEPPHAARHAASATTAAAAAAACAARAGRCAGRAGAACSGVVGPWAFIGLLLSGRAGRFRGWSGVACGRWRVPRSAEILALQAAVGARMRERRELAARADTEPRVDAREVELHGLDADGQLGSDLAVTLAGGDQQCHRPF